jgi:septal ring factor EnvC (AmiA/AmiB activator)
MKKIIYGILVVLITNFTYSADSIEDIKQEINKIDSGIKDKKEKIVGVKKEEASATGKLKEIEKAMIVIKDNLNNREAKRVELIKNIAIGEKNIKEIEKELVIKNRGLKGKILRWYRYNNNRNMDYLFSGENMLEIMEKQHNLKRLVEHDQGQIKDLGETKKKLEAQKRKVEREKSELEGIIRELAEQRQELNVMIIEKNRLIKILKGQEVKFKKELKNLGSQKKKMEKAIENIIKARERERRERERKQREKELKEQREKAVREGKEIKENKEIVFEEKNYEASQILEKLGGTIRPLNGEIVVSYGQIKAGKVSSTGIEIKGKLGDRVKSVASGEVIYAGRFENMGTVIIIDHGYGFVSVYGNLINSYVSNGSKVSKGQNIGVLGLSTEEKEPILYFETRLRAKIVSPSNFLK